MDERVWKPGNQSTSQRRRVQSKSARRNDSSKPATILLSVIHVLSAAVVGTHCQELRSKDGPNSQTFGSNSLECADSFCLRGFPSARSGNRFLATGLDGECRTCSFRRPPSHHVSSFGDGSALALRSSQHRDRKSTRLN